MQTSEIIDRIQDEQKGFAAIYRSASKFVDSGPLWDFCMDTIRDPVAMSAIAFANDLGVPPVRSLITIYERKMHPTRDFTASESQHMGALMGFVFKFVLGYRSQKERVQVNHLGVRTATRFLDGPLHEFEK